MEDFSKALEKEMVELVGRREELDRKINALALYLNLTKGQVMSIWRKTKRTIQYPL